MIVQYPNFFGSIEDLAEIKENRGRKRCPFHCFSANPLAVGTFASPGKLGADIVIGDIQPTWYSKCPLVAHIVVILP